MVRGSSVLDPWRRWAADHTDETGVRQLTTLQGWRSFVLGTPTTPDLAEAPATQDASPHLFDEARLAHHSRMLVITTSAIRQVITQGRRLTYINRYADFGRAGLIISGPARTGKTTALTQLGKTIEIIHHQRFQHSPTDIPVLYITTPPAATPRMIAVEFARFLGLPVFGKSNLTDVVEAVCGVCVDARTSLVCVDEIHNISLTTRYGAEASDTLKYFAERLPATFVYAGIDVERAGLLSGPRGEQIAGRFGMIRTCAFPLSQEWAALLAAIDEALRLKHHVAGTLPALDRYLHQRTGGMIGSLLRLIRSAAIQAILDGTEQITQDSLENINIDTAADYIQGTS